MEESVADVSLVSDKCAGTTMRVHHLQHVAFEGLGSIETWLKSAGHSIAHTRQFLNDPLPTVDQFDWLIVMGGPMGATDEAQLPWMGPEKALIRQAIDAGKLVLGVCLGAQMIASVLGARVFQNEQREIGWFSIQRSPDAIQLPFGTIFPDRIEVFHWHGDTFDLPAGAVRLASSEATKNQAFAVGDNVLALQFHLEMTPGLASNLIDNCQNELGPSPCVQNPERIMATPDQFRGINRLMESVLQAMSSSHKI